VYVPTRGGSQEITNRRGLLCMLMDKVELDDVREIFLRKRQATKMPVWCVRRLWRW
jgi:hypothetical protein